MASDLRPFRSRPQASESREDGGGQNAGWSIFSYLIAGMAVYGGLGWLIGRWTHIAALIPIGTLVGLGVGIFAVIYKYGRQ
jgi:ATP synthase protein I